MEYIGDTTLVKLQNIILYAFYEKNKMLAKYRQINHDGLASGILFHAVMFSFFNVKDVLAFLLSF